MPMACFVCRAQQVDLVVIQLKFHLYDQPHACLSLGFSVRSDSLLIEPFPTWPLLFNPWPPMRSIMKNFHYFYIIKIRVIHVMHLILPCLLFSVWNSLSLSSTIENASLWTHAFLNAQTHHWNTCPLHHFSPALTNSNHSTATSFDRL